MRTPLAPLLAALLGCTTPAPPASPPPVVAVGAPQRNPVEVPATTPSHEKAPAIDYEPCVATMFDHEAGLHDRFVEEDATGLYGFRNAAGSWVIRPRFQFAYPFSPDGIAAVIEGGEPAFIDTNGRVIAAAYLYDNGPDYFTERRARITAGGKIGFIDDEGKVVVPPRYDYASAFCHGLAVVCIGCVKRPGDHGGHVGGKWGFVDRQGRIAIALQFSAVDERFDPDVAVVVLDGKKVRIDRSGRVVSP